MQLPQRRVDLASQDPGERSEKWSRHQNNDIGFPEHGLTIDFNENNVRCQDESDIDDQTGAQVLKGEMNEMGCVEVVQIKGARYEGQRLFNSAFYIECKQGDNSRNEYPEEARYVLINLMRPSPYVLGENRIHISILLCAILIIS